MLPFFASALNETDQPPVGSLIGGATEAALIYEDLPVNRLTDTNRLDLSRLIKDARFFHLIRGRIRQQELLTTRCRNMTDALFRYLRSDS